MKHHKLGQRSKRKLDTVHVTLQKLVKRALELSEYDFGVTEGIRTKQRQKYLVSIGKSLTMNSYHLRGHAVDVIAYDEYGKSTWKMQYYEQVALAFYKAADEMNVRITWGGTWKSLKDGPHFQIEL